MFHRLRTLPPCLRVTLPHLLILLAGISNASAEHIPAQPPPPPHPFSLTPCVPGQLIIHLTPEPKAFQLDSIKATLHATSCYRRDILGRNLIDQSSENPLMIPVALSVRSGPDPTEQQLTFDNSFHFVPQWSPNGQTIVYQKQDASGFFQVYAIPAAGGNETALTFDAFHHLGPQWSPAGNAIVYSKVTPQEPQISRIFVVPATGGSERALTADSFDMVPQWSPDGSFVAFERHAADGIGNMYKVSLNGGTPTALTHSTIDSRSPQWSPDGSTIVFERFYFPDLLQIYTAPTVPGDERALTPEQGGYHLPQWAPDGERIAVAKKDATGLEQIYLISTRDGTETALTFDGFRHWGPEWSPDGRVLAYYKKEGSEFNQIYVIPASGGEERALTFDHVQHYSPQWSPTGDALTYFRFDATGNSAQIFRIAVGGAEGMAYFTVNPCRVLDTRNPAGPYGGPALAANTTRTLKITGQCGIPSSARAVALNVAVTQPSAGGNLRLYAAGATVPQVSAINYGAGQTRTNNGIIGLDDQGNLTVRCVQTSGTAHAILDVSGYFAVP